MSSGWIEEQKNMLIRLGFTHYMASEWAKNTKTITDTHAFRTVSKQEVSENQSERLLRINQWESLFGTQTPTETYSISQYYFTYRSTPTHIHTHTHTHSLTHTHTHTHTLTHTHSYKQVHWQTNIQHHVNIHTNTPNNHHIF